MVTVDVSGNYHGKDGRFTQKTQAESQDLEDCSEFAEMDEMDFDDLREAQLNYPTAEGRMHALREVLREQEYDYVNCEALRKYPELEMEAAQTICSMAIPYTDETGKTYCPGYAEALDLGLEDSDNPQIRRMIGNIAHDYALEEEAAQHGWRRAW